MLFIHVHCGSLRMVAIQVTFEVYCVYVNLLFACALDVQVKHHSRNCSDSVGWSLQGQACCVLEAVGIRPSVGYRCVIFSIHALNRVLIVFRICRF